MIVLNNRTSEDDYTLENTLLASFEKLDFTIANAAVYVQVADPDLPPGTGWQPEVFRIPGIYSLQRKGSGARFRSAATGAPAQVTLEALGAGE